MTTAWFTSRHSTCVERAPARRRAWVLATLLVVCLVALPPRAYADGKPSVRAIESGQQLSQLLYDALRKSAGEDPTERAGLEAEAARLLARKPDLEQDIEGITPLLFAVSLNLASTVEKLLAASANPAAEGQSGENVLALALRTGNPAMLRAVITPKTLVALRVANGDPDRALWHRALLGLEVWRLPAGSVEAFADQLLSAGYSGLPEGPDGTVGLTAAACTGSVRAAKRLLEGGAQPGTSVLACLDKLPPTLRHAVHVAARRGEPGPPGTWVTATLVKGCQDRVSVQNAGPVMGQLLAEVQDELKLGFTWPSADPKAAPLDPELGDILRCASAMLPLEHRALEPTLARELLAAEPPALRAARLARRLPDNPELFEPLLAASPDTPIRNENQNLLFVRLPAAARPLLAARGYRIDITPAGLAKLIDAPDLLGAARAQGAHLLQEEAGQGLVPAFRKLVEDFDPADTGPLGLQRAQYLKLTQAELLAGGFDWRRQDLATWSGASDAALLWLAKVLPAGYGAEQAVLEEAAKRRSRWREPFRQASQHERECRLPGHSDSLVVKAMDAMEHEHAGEMQAIWIDLDGDGVCDLWMWRHSPSGGVEVELSPVDAPTHGCEDGDDAGFFMLSSSRQHLTPLTVGEGAYLARVVDHPDDQQRYVLTTPGAGETNRCETSRTGAWRAARELATAVMATPEQRLASAGVPTPMTRQLGTLDTEVPALFDASWAIHDPRTPPHYCPVADAPTSLEPCPGHVAGRKDSNAAHGAGTGSASGQSRRLDDRRYAQLLSNTPALQQADAELNSNYRHAMQVLDTAGKKQLRETQRCWLNWRRQQGLSDTVGTAGATAEGRGAGGLTPEDLVAVTGRQSKWIGSVAEVWQAARVLPDPISTACGQH